MKKSFLLLFCILATNSLFCASMQIKTPAKPIAILGNYTKTLINKIIITNNIKYKKMKNWLPVSEYKKYSVIIFTDGLRTTSHVNYSNNVDKWNTPEAQEEVNNYLKSGGEIIITGACFCGLTNKGRNLEGIKSILGFAYYSTPADAAGVKITSSLFPFGLLSKDKTYHWQSSIGVSKLSSAQVLAYYVSKKGGQLFPFATVNKIGKGKVYWFGLPIVRLFINLSKSGRNIGEADEAGKFILNEQGKDAELYCKIIAKTILSAMPARHNLKKEKWEPIPLGAKGTLSYHNKMNKIPKASLVNTEVKNSSLLIAENGKAKVDIIFFKNSSKTTQKCSQILKQHLDEISGANFKIRKADPSSNANSSNIKKIIIGTYKEIKSELTKSDIVFNDAQSEEIILKTTGNTLIIAGSDENGVRHALYTFLESLGCRYLWPGNLGKVIPHKSSFYAPKLNIKEAPKLVMRHIRMLLPKGRRVAVALSKIGLNQEDFMYNYKKALKPLQEDDGWYVWHRLGIRKSFSRGHSFGDYYTKYGKSHPDWFALQPNGGRNQFLSKSRPRLCHSSKSLVQQIVKSIVAQFDADSRKESASICLNDGGYTTFCLCEKCRKLDPVNAPSLKMRCYAMGIQPFSYVSLTDRILWFSNEIARGVAKKYPDKKLSIYVYSLYSKPPVSVKPHPNLLIFYTGMNYENEDLRQAALKSWSAWCSFGNPMFFRPNCLLANRKKIMPQNFSKKLFNDFKYIYNRNLIGTDFDSCTNNWALDGLNTYILAKTHWNPNKLSYDNLVQDYCKSGFGSGWKNIYDYFLELEKLSNKAAIEKTPIFNLYNENVFKKLNSLLKKASEATNNTGEIIPRKRVKFIKAGLDFAIAQKKFYDLIKVADSREKKDVLIKNYKKILRDLAERNMLAVNLPFAVRYNKYLKTKK